MKGPLAASPWHLFLAVAGLIATAGAAVILFLFDPATTGVYPVCLLHLTTGLLCPGCGTLRAMHQLTHGNFAAAWRLNCFVMSLFPIAAWLAARELVWLSTGKRLPGIVTRPVFGWALVVGLVVFGVARNLPVFR
ncbi:MAG: DUF2752 domain-containing protein [Verrucomicrobiota bacterium]|jgi:hypothetical protein